MVAGSPSIPSLKESHIMKRICIAFATAASLAAIDMAHAQQHQEYGRGSLHVTPGQPSKPAAPRGEGLVNHFGRDSLYVTQLPTPPSSAPTQAQSNQRFGRESVYAKGSPYSPNGTGGDTSVGAADRKQGHGG
jgi:hypothetical protein